MSPTYRDFTICQPGVSGDERTRTADPLLAKQVLYQLSYVPELTTKSIERPGQVLKKGVSRLAG